MRLLHFSDLHLGVDNYGRIDPANGLSTRVNDFLRVFDIIVDRAIAERYDAVLFTGDAFKNRDPSQTLQREFARRIIRLSQAETPIVIIVGNHDLPNSENRATPVDIYDVLEIPHVYICRAIEKIDVVTAAGTLQVVALPWITRSLLRSSNEYLELPDDELDRQMQSLISQAVGIQMRSLSPQHPAVLMAHVSLQGATLGMEQSVMLGDDVTLGVDDLHVRGFDYVALGHIHKHQQVTPFPPTVYAGSPERIDFGEEREAKGYVSVEILPGDAGPRTTTWTFEELPARRFVTIRIQAEGDDVMTEIRRTLEREVRNIEGAIVRCVIQVEANREKSVALAEVRRILQDARPAHIAYITVDSKMMALAREYIDDAVARDSMTMLQRWLEGQNYDARLRERILQRGRELIEQHKGAEIES